MAKNSQLVPLPIVVVGGGRMGEAIITGILATGLAKPGDIRVAEPDAERRAQLTGSFGVAVAGDASSLVGDAALVILAVKPQVVDVVVSGMSDALPSKPPVVVSIAAGVPTARLESQMPSGVPVLRVMPNTPAMVGAGISAISAGAHADAHHTEMAVTLFTALGEAVVVDEGLQDAVTGVSGSGPAYVAIFLEALAEAGARHGLSPEAAYALSLQTLKGTAELLEATGQSPADLVEIVSSPGGTTVAAREALSEGRFSEVIGEAVDAAVLRAKELGGR